VGRGAYREFKEIKDFKEVGEVLLKLTKLLIAHPSFPPP
jgi:hypothetical protein